MNASWRATLLVCLDGCLLVAGCETEPDHWAYNTCGDPNAVDVSASVGGGIAASLPVDVNTLLDEMTALGRLAHRARDPFRTCMVSSYDRSSQVPDASNDTPTDWYANHDWGNYLGAEDGPRGARQFVLLDADGPGAIVRVWSATPAGTLRIYFDHAKIPALEVFVAEILSGQVAPFVPPFAGTTAKGGNLEFPLPFRRHVKVSWEGPVGFYQIAYRKYSDPATEVASFDLLGLDWGKLNDVGVGMQQPAVQDTSMVSEQGVLSGSSPELSIAASPAGEEIVSLKVHPNLIDPAHLRGSILSLRFDGQETVRAPLGDFFGAGPGLLPHATLPLQATVDGDLTAGFVMPFGQAAVVRLDAMAGLEATVTVSHRPAAFDGNSYYFHAHWTARGPMPARPFRDVPLADLAGAGAYVGTFLAVGNSSSEWWGEGDDKVWVDDDAFPSLYGTGTEDYFGQGYCSPEIYNHPYRAQSLAAGGFGTAKGLFSLLRAHVLDPIRFTNSLKFNLELWHWDEGAKVTFDTVTYFYLSQDGIDNLPLPAFADFRLSPLGP
jgi:Protein of unknown function (DUF2961)